MEGEEAKVDPPAEQQPEMEAPAEGGEPAMEGMDPEMGMEGEPEEGASPDAQPADAMEGEMEEEMGEPEEDFSQDTRMQEMINHLTECLENFKQEDHWKNEHYHWLKDFLEQPENNVIFFWNDFEAAND